jgi:hypothetical protein
MAAPPEILAHGGGQVGHLIAKSFAQIGSIKHVSGVKSFTAAQIKALRASPQTIIPSFGTGTLIVPVRGALVLKAGTNVLTESAANLAWRYVGQAAVVLATSEMTGFIDQATSRVMFPLFNANDLAFAKTVCDGLGIELFNTGAGEFGGNAANDAVLSVYLDALVLTPNW